MRLLERNVSNADVVNRVLLATIEIGKSELIERAIEVAEQLLEQPARIQSNSTDGIV